MPKKTTARKVRKTGGTAAQKVRKTGGITKGTRLTRWNTLTPEQIADKMAMFGKPHNSERFKGKCLLCSKQIFRQTYLMCSGSDKTVAHKKCVDDMVARQPVPKVDPNKEAKIEIPKGAEPVKAAFTPRQYDPASFNAGFTACLKKIMFALNDDPITVSRIIDITYTGAVNGAESKVLTPA